MLKPKKLYQSNCSACSLTSLPNRSKRSGGGELNIAIDYDNTFTRDPELWKDFILRSKENGHKIFCVTCRRPTDENAAELEAAFDGYDVMIFYTSLKPKWNHMADRNIWIDIWIDDDPGSVMMGK